MQHLTLEKSPQMQQDIDVLKSFFGTVSEGAAVRSAIIFAQLLARCAKNKTIIVRDLNKGGHARIIIST